ncbi:MAG: hypothetical protein K6F09_04995 [Clostridiales bacterium]|nr:hypothetical protein [Clostridiales bacterium]
MNLVFAFVGVAVGAVQSYLLRKISDGIVSADKRRLFLPAAIKAVLYVIFIPVFVFLLRKYLIPFLIGFGVGIMGLTVYYFIKSNIRSKEQR